MIAPPAKPFPNYKWRWASFAPSEGLNDPATYLGVLRAWVAHEGEAPSDPRVIADLRRVQEQAATNVDLERTGDRNLWRNSGQYWKALGLMADAHGVLRATPFGRDVASGAITPGAFAAAVINSLTLPNRMLERDTSDWNRAGLTIKPLQLILQIMESLAANYGQQEGYITPDELVKIVIPLAGAKAPLVDHSTAINQYRQHKLLLLGWPDCAPADNDPRMAKEFLLFLSHYGFCGILEGDSRDEDRYRLIAPGSMQSLISLPPVPDPRVLAKQVQSAGWLADVERERVAVSVLARPQQTEFRRRVLAASGGRCAITGTTLQDVLQAAHIKPVSAKGNDDVANGLCMRADIHLMFDTGHLRMDRGGKLHLTAEATKDRIYAALPTVIAIPSYVNLDLIEWRWRYT